MPVGFLIDKTGVLAQQLPCGGVVGLGNVVFCGGADEASVAVVAVGFALALPVRASLYGGPDEVALHIVLVSADALGFLFGNVWECVCRYAVFVPFFQFAGSVVTVGGGFAVKGGFEYQTVSLVIGKPVRFAVFIGQPNEAAGGVVGVMNRAAQGVGAPFG